MSTDAVLFAEIGRSYREITSFVAEYLLQRLLFDTQFDILQLTLVEFQTYAKNLLYVDKERAIDVGKFLFVHKQEVVDGQKFTERYEKVDKF